MSENNTNSNIKSLLLKIKAKFVLKKLFNNLDKSKIFDIIRYNKVIQAKFTNDINHYRKEYLKTEIEIKVKLFLYENSKFINLSSKKYLHIYNKDGERKKNYLHKSQNQSVFKIIIDPEISSFSGLFANCINIEKIDFIKFNRTEIKNMNNMFHGCSSLKEINLNNFITRIVKDMSHMFHGCSSLKEINLSNFDTKSVTDMSHMFHGCFLLKKINLNNFDTKEVVDMNHISS